MTDICDHSPSVADHTALLGRLKRVEGQVRGVAGMIEDERYCLDILIQISAIKSALTAVEREVLKSHADHCVENALASGNIEDQRQKFAELIDVALRRPV